MWLLLMVLVTGSGGNAKPEIRHIQEFEAKALCEKYDQELSNTMFNMLNKANAAEIRFEMKCIQVR